MNRLQAEKSPYLLQHADNPVDWRPWGEEAFAAARREDKPIFLSIGYSTCHWCHVMARESFACADVAEQINRDFIPIKVDREERPDVDAVYMAACLAMNGSGGWPLTVLLTPDQKPFWAGTYLPKTQLTALLRQASGLWKEDRANVESAGARLTEQLRHAAESGPGTLNRGLIQRGAAAFARLFDPVWGGFGRAPKFPSAHNLLFLLRCAQLTGDTHALLMAETTLEHMARGGIYDHIGGGFSRYSTDGRWLIPHFEKMLYDNALLALAYAEAYRMTARSFYRDVACRTLDYCLTELSGPTGGFCCGQDADSEEEEGKHYIFTPQEMTELLGADAQRFCRRFGVTEKGNFHGKNVLNLIQTDDWESEPENFDALRQTVYCYRKDRVPLHRDDKVLTAWNGLMIAALARAGAILGEERYLQAAAAAVEFIESHLRDADGRLLARWRDGEAAHPGKLDDCAFYSWGLLELYGATFRTEFLKKAVDAADQMLRGFFDADNGGFYPYAADGEQLITRTKESYDGAMPSGNAVAALVLSRLGRLIDEQSWRETAKKQLEWLAGAAEEYPAGHGFALLAFLEELWPTQELVVSAREEPAELLRFLWSKPRPGLTVLVKTPDNSEYLAQLAPFTAAYPVPETGARYYLCQNGSCDTPVDSLGELKDRLTER